MTPDALPAVAEIQGGHPLLRGASPAAKGGGEVPCVNFHSISG